MSDLGDTSCTQFESTALVSFVLARHCIGVVWWSIYFAYSHNIRRIPLSLFAVHNCIATRQERFRFYFLAHTWIYADQGISSNTTYYNTGRTLVRNLP